MHVPLHPRASSALHRHAGLFLFLMFSAFLPAISQGEWYVAGYGGWSAPGKLSDVKMDNFGQSQALIFFPGTTTFLTGGKTNTLTQSFKTNDLDLKQSVMFGGKVGYFFKDEGLNWLGVELEAFTSLPTIKSQTVQTKHDITYIPNDPISPPCQFGNTCLTQQTNAGTLRMRCPFGSTPPASA